ncbi:hypothetical protein FJT64_006794 [Amphibalanus amphitrite]|uniref:Uncharacterized protein n=1 Tax=Amphibalanus amphitrite TaxID=1232801 RepID=A0A6A4VGX8_AMPAM|nr:hypothetical protein FJT64_006794 [Amphibalanus amphitrite]
MTLHRSIKQRESWSSAEIEQLQLIQQIMLEAQAQSQSSQSATNSKTIKKGSRMVAGVLGSLRDDVNRTSAGGRSAVQTQGLQESAVGEGGSAAAVGRTAAARSHRRVPLPARGGGGPSVRAYRAAAVSSLYPASVAARLGHRQSHVELLEREMRAAARTITGCPLSTPAHAVMAEAGLMPVAARRDVLAAKLLARAHALPEGDPLRAVAEGGPPSRLKTVTGWRGVGMTPGGLLGSMAVTCRKLKILYLISSIENRQAVLNALHETDLGCDGGQSGTVDFNVPSK